MVAHAYNPATQKAMLWDNLFAHSEDVSLLRHLLIVLVKSRMVNS